MTENRVLIVGGGIGGLTLALCLHARGIACRVFEQASAFRPLGVGINILPHASAELGAPRPCRCARTRFGPHARGGFLQPLRPAHLPRAARTLCRLHASAILDSSRAAARRAASRGRRAPWARCGGHGRRVHARRRKTGNRSRRISKPGALRPRSGDALVACDGLHSVVRKALHPDEGPPLYSGVNMWRGVTHVAAHSHRRQHDPRGLARERQDGDLPDRGRRGRRRPAARQLGGGDRDAAACRRATGTAAASSATSSARSPIGNSTGSTCRQ